MKVIQQKFQNYCKINKFVKKEEGMSLIKVQHIYLQVSEAASKNVSCMHSI